MKNHKIEANFFYELKQKLKQENVFNFNANIIIIKISKNGFKVSLNLNENCDFEINFFNKSFDINCLQIVFSGIPKAYKSILPIMRDKLLRCVYMRRHPSHIACNFYFNPSHRGLVAAIFYLDDAINCMQFCSAIANQNAKHMFIYIF